MVFVKSISDEVPSGLVVRALQCADARLQQLVMLAGDQFGRLEVGRGSRAKGRRRKRVRELASFGLQVKRLKQRTTILSGSAGQTVRLDDKIECSIAAQ